MKSSDTTLLGLFRATWKERRIVPRFFIVILELFCRGIDAVLQIASSVRSGVILWASGTHHWLYYNGDAGGISGLTLHYQGQKSRLGVKKNRIRE